MKGYTLEGDIIVLNREITELDLFVKHFLEVFKKYSDYLIVSGFVSISTGRTRGTEDVDMLIPILDKEKFKELFNELSKNYWCYQGDDSEEVYEYIKTLESIRFAEIDRMFPNMEVIPFDKTKKAKYFEFHHPQKIRVKDFEFKIPPIEFEILYKEIRLGGEKDLEDAKHLRNFFKDILNEERFEEYKKVIL